MSWILVFVYFYLEIPYVIKVGSYDSMTKCFEARETLGAEQSGSSGYFPNGQQAVCIPLE